jgi:hypothetical protein
MVEVMGILPVIPAKAGIQEVVLPISTCLSVLSCALRDSILTDPTQSAHRESE